METIDPLVAFERKLKVLYPIGCGFKPIGNIGIPVGGTFVPDVEQEIFLEVTFDGTIQSACFKRMAPDAQVLVKDHRGFIYVRDRHGKEHYADVVYPDNYNYFNH
jgi:hypothetical protein